MAEPKPLTAAQRDILKKMAEGETLCFGRTLGNYWIGRNRVQARTFDTLLGLRFIAYDKSMSGLSRSVYTITDAGRSALT